MNLYKRKIYKKSLQHGQKWRDHKYLYIDANGNYVYPKDAGRKIRQRLVGKTEQEKRDEKFLDYFPPAGTNKKNDQIASAHRNAVIKKKNPDTGRSYIEDRREHDSNVAKALRAAKDYSKQISREHENEEASRKVNKEEKLRNIRARKVSKGIEDRFRESELARDFDSKVKKRKKKKALKHSNTYRSNVMNSHQRMIYSSQLQHTERRNHKYLYKIGDRYIYPEDVKGVNPRQKANRQYQHLKNSKIIGEEKERERRDRKYNISREIEDKEYDNPITRYAGEGYKAGRNEIDQIHSAHQRSTKEIEVPVHQYDGKDTIGRKLYVNRRGDNRAKSLDKKVTETSERKKKKAKVEPVKPTRNISGVKPGGKAPVKETPTSEKKRRSIDRDDLRTYKKTAGMMLDEGRQNEINRRKERSERTKAGNAKMAKEINSDNAKKVGKAILYNSKLGKLVKAGELMDDNRKLKKRKASR